MEPSTSGGSSDSTFNLIYMYLDIRTYFFILAEVTFGSFLLVVLSPVTPPIYPPRSYSYHERQWQFAGRWERGQLGARMQISGLLGLCPAPLQCSTSPPPPPELCRTVYTHIFIKRLWGDSCWGFVWRGNLVIPVCVYIGVQLYTAFCIANNGYSRGELG